MTVLNELEEGGLSFITDCTEEDKAFKNLGKVLNTFDIDIEGLDSFVKWIKICQEGEGYHVQPNLEIAFENKEDLYALYNLDALICQYFGSLVMIEPSLFITDGESIHSYLVTLSKEIISNFMEPLKKYKLIEDEMITVDILMGYYDYFKKYVKNYITKSIVKCHPRITVDNVISITNLVNVSEGSNKLTIPSDYGLLLDMERSRIFIYLADVKYTQIGNTLEGLLTMRIRRVKNADVYE